MLNLDLKDVKPKKKKEPNNLRAKKKLEWLTKNVVNRGPPENGTCSREAGNGY